MTEKSFNDDLKIDKHSLDKEWEKHPQLTFDYGKDTARKEKERDRLKDKIEIEKANLEKQIRKEPESFGIAGKPTENAIRAVITTSEGIKKLQNEYHDLVEECKILNTAKSSITDTKTKALDGITKLQISGLYSSTPNNNITDKTERKNERKEIKKKRKERK